VNLIILRVRSLGKINAQYQVWRYQMLILSDRRFNIVRIMPTRILAVIPCNAMVVVPVSPVI